MVSYFVRYRGKSADPASFRTYYAETHAAILERFPKIHSLILHQPVAWDDPFPVRRDETTLLAQMIFGSSVDLNMALRSQARKEARDDFSYFPAFEGEITHEALVGQVIF